MAGFGFGDPAPAVAAAPPPAAPAKPYEPSFFDILQGVLFDGQSPAASAMAARQRNYQNQMMQQLPGLLSELPAGVQAAAVLGGPKVWEEVVKNYAPVTRSAGQETDYFGGAGRPGGYSNATDTYGVDDKSGKPIEYGPKVDGVSVLGPSLGGGYGMTSSGAILGERKGDVTGRVGVPQIVPFGSSLQDYQPSVPGSPAAGGPGASPGQPQTPGAPLDGSTFFRSFIMPHEGGYNPADLNGAPVKYGINQSANPGVDVKHLTPDGAEQIFLKNYWGKSGAANLPAGLAAVHADTYYINPKMAKSFLAQSNGDPNAYLQLRESWMQRLAQNNPKARIYADAWARRNADLQQYINNGDTPPPPAPPNPNGPAEQPASQYGGARARVTTLAQGRGTHLLSQPEADAAGLPPGSYQRSPTGEISPVPGTTYGPEQLISLRGQLADKEPIKNFQQSMDAYGAMVRSAAQPSGGMRAYALRDTFARAINPGAVARSGTIEAIKQAQGVPANIKGYLMNLKGDGDVPPQIAQQILDVTHSFVASHYADAKALNDSSGDFAKRHRINPEDITMPLGDTPGRMVLGALPPKAQMVAGQIYVTPRGPAVWTGTGFKLYGGH